MSTDEASMFDSGREGQDRASSDAPQHQQGPLSVDELVPVLHAHGGDYARLLRQRRPGSRADRSGWRFYAQATAKAAGDDVEVHQILIDMGVAAQHLSADVTLRAYASSKRQRVQGPLAAAFLDGMIDRIDRFPHDVLRLNV